MQGSEDVLDGITIVHYVHVERDENRNLLVTKLCVAPFIQNEFKQLQINSR